MHVRAPPSQRLPVEGSVVLRFGLVDAWFSVYMGVYLHRWKLSATQTVRYPTELYPRLFGNLELGPMGLGLVYRGWGGLKMHAFRAVQASRKECR